MLHGMEGTPYIYQGEELGMTNIRLPISEYRDLEIHNVYQERLQKGYAPEKIMESIYARGRDNARTPMQWTCGKNAGFSDGTPWLPVNPNYEEINVEKALADSDSIFHYYQKLIALRKKYPVLVHGDFTLLEEEHPRLFVYRRSWQKEELLVVCNFSGEETDYTLPEEWQEAECLIANYPPQQAVKPLRPWEAMILHRTAVL